MIFRLKECREYEAYSMSEIANRLKVAKSTYSMWELEADIIPVKRIVSLANIYGVSIDYLFKFSNNREKSKSYPPLNLTLIANNLKSIRLKLGLTQKELAENIHIASSSLSNYENGKALITTLPLLEFCKTYNFTVEQILFTKIQL